MNVSTTISGFAQGRGGGVAVVIHGLLQTLSRLHLVLCFVSGVRTFSWPGEVFCVNKIVNAATSFSVATVGNSSSFQEEKFPQLISLINYCSSCFH